MQGPVGHESGERDLGSGVNAGAGAWYALLLLTACHIVAAADARLPLILVQSIKADLGLSDTEIGLIIGPAFSITYAIAAIPIARLSDRYARKYIMGVAISVWSLFTAAAGTATGFATMLMARTGLAVGESALIPASHSIIADSFAPQFRARAIAVFSTGVPIGAFLALALGGYINDRYGWRIAMFSVGASGLLLAFLLLLTLREPARKVPIGAEAAGAQKKSIRSLFADPVIRHTIFGGTILCVAHGTIAWMPAYMLRAFEMSASQVGASFGAVAGLAGLVGVVAGGVINDLLARRDARHAFRWLAGAFVLGALLKALALLTPSLPAFLLLIAISTLLLTFYPGPTYAMIQSRVGTESRSFASAVTLFCLQGLGISFGGFLTGWLSDHLPFGGDAERLRWAIVIVALFSIWSAFHYVWATRYLRAAEAAGA